jgi:hypothetical protein
MGVAALVCVLGRDISPDNSEPMAIVAAEAVV